MRLGPTIYHDSTPSYVLQQLTVRNRRCLPLLSNPSSSRFMELDPPGAW